MNADNTHVVEEARNLLNSGWDGVLGLKQRWGRVGPYVFGREDELEDLVLEPRYPMATILRQLLEAESGRKFGVVARGCDARAIKEMLLYDETREGKRPIAVDSYHVIGVACGDGVKERRLLGALAAAGRMGLPATPVDVSVPLVTAAAGAMAAVPGVDASHAVAADITAVPDLSPLLAPRRAGTRLVTLFGVISTLGPGALAPATSLLDPGDLLLVSANLLADRPGARDAVMAQYDNPPTRDWLAAVLEDIGIADAGPITFRWDDAADGPVIVGEVTPAATVVARVDGLEVSMPAGAPIRVLESYRHTPDALARLAARQGLDLRDVITSPSGEEGVAVAVR